MNSLAKLLAATALTSIATLSMAEPVQSPTEAPASEATADPEIQSPAEAPASEIVGETPVAQ